MNFKDEGCQEPTNHPQPISLRKKNWTDIRPIRQSKNSNGWVEVEVVNLEE
jgi:hypothetical protein